MSGRKKEEGVIIEGGWISPIELDYKKASFMKNTPKIEPLVSNVIESPNPACLVNAETMC